MKLAETTFTIELTKEEIEAIVTALHGEYKFIGEDVAKETDGARVARRLKEKALVQKLRNDFAALVGRMFCGIDA